MTPLDDELRRTLSARAATVAPSPDPLSGIEARASGMRRRRTAASMAGAMVVVAAVAVAVPALLPEHGTSRPDVVGTTPTASPSATPSAVAAPQPPNVLAWPSRGTASVGPSVHDLEVAFTRGMGRSDGTAVHYRPLFTGDTDSGVHYTMGQAWFEGDDVAYSVSYATGRPGGPELFLGPVTPPNPAVLAFLLGNLPGTTVDQLVVVPTPTTGQVSYDTNATGSFRPITGQDHLDGVVLIDRAKDASTDRLELLTGNGDLDHPLYRGPVTSLLCGVRECG